ncbi:MAG: hypothetical protein U0625_06525 [Phycisphaerales bacterium]
MERRCNSRNPLARCARPAAARIEAIAVVAALAMAFGAAVPRAGAQESAPKTPGSTAKAPDAAPAFPTELPEGSHLPDATPPTPVRADIFIGRVIALERVQQCGRCNGKGTRTTRQRGNARSFESPRVTEVVDDCPDCDGTGYTDNATRTCAVLDALTAALGGLSTDLPAAPKHFDRAREALERLGASGALAERVAAQDRNELLGERLEKRGTPVCLVGKAGKPFPVGGGLRAVPVLVDGRALVLVRMPVISVVPADGEVLAGGVLSGRMPETEWKFGRAPVLDGGFLVPHTPAAHKGPGAAGSTPGAAPGAGAAGTGASGGGINAGQTSGGTRRSGN